MDTSSPSVNARRPTAPLPVHVRRRAPDDALGVDSTRGRRHLEDSVHKSHCVEFGINVPLQDRRRATQPDDIGYACFSSATSPDADKSFVDARRQVGFVSNQLDNIVMANKFLFDPDFTGATPTAPPPPPQVAQLRSPPPRTSSPSQQSTTSEEVAAVQPDGTLHV